MKPRNKRERLVESVRGQLPTLSEKQAQWARETCPEHVARAVVNVAWCAECGGSFPVGRYDTQVTCPHCGQKLKVERTRRQSGRYFTYFTTLATCHGFQVLRHYEMECQERKSRERHCCITEVAQLWIDHVGKSVVIARPCTIYGWYWLKTLPMSIKRESCVVRSRYDFWSEVCPYGGVLSVLRRNGFSMALLRRDVASPYQLMTTLLTDNFAETLVKTHRWEMLDYHLKSGRLEHFRYAVNICHRNGYEVADVALWVDYLRLLEELHLDTHNAHYVCPADLRGEHDRMLLRRQRMEEEERRRQRERETRKYERAYRQAKGKYFGICFGNERIVVSVIASVREMAEEGKTMHHCVYAMKYFQEKDSLILSAKSRDGLRLETVEVNLASLSVVQSRGRCNSTTEYHDEIVALVMANMGMINKAKRGV